MALGLARRRGVAGQSFFFLTSFGSPLAWASSRPCPFVMRGRRCSIAVIHRWRYILSSGFGYSNHDTLIAQGRLRYGSCLSPLNHPTCGAAIREPIRAYREGQRCAIFAYLPPPSGCSASMTGANGLGADTAGPFACGHDGGLMWERPCYPFLPGAVIDSWKHRESCRLRRFLCDVARWVLMVV
jgi:hypothetical protein